MFAPPLMLGCLGWNRFRKTDHGRFDAYFFLSCFVIQLLLYSRWWDWSSDDAWGIRFMIPGVLLMCIPLIEILHHRAAVLAIAAAGIYIQLLAVLVSGLDFVLLMHQGTLERTALYVGDERRQNVDFEDYRFNPRYGQIAGQWLLIRVKLGRTQIARTARAEDQRTGTPLYETLPPAAWETSQWDFIWLPKRRKPH